jgi:hypothetical protein
MEDVESNFTTRPQVIVHGPQAGELIFPINIMEKNAKWDYDQCELVVEPERTHIALQNRQTLLSFNR